MESESGSHFGPASEIDWNNIKIPLYDEVHLRYSLDKDSVTAMLKNIWNGKEGTLEGLHVNMWTSPFKVCEVEDFLFDDDFVQDLIRDIEDFDLVEKSSDLYKFRQSTDLTSIDHPEVNTLLRFLKGKCRSWLEDITGFELAERVDATFSSYTQGDYLLCHDDKCENRKIAFILYCSQKHERYYGGTLDLYDTDGSGQPRDVVRSILPAYNKFVFFEVSDISYHRVAEVRSIECNRISVNGWFYAKEAPNIILPKSPTIEVSIFLPHELTESEVTRLVNKQYLQEDVQRPIRTYFEDHSETMLHEFLLHSFVKKLTLELDQHDGWIQQGPPSRRSFQALAEGYQEVSPYLSHLLQVFKSKAMFKLLAKMTGLNLNNEEGQGNPRGYIEVQRWKGGSYSLINEYDRLPASFALEVALFIKPFVNGEGCGHITYVDSENGDHLLSVPPVDNALALTYRDSATHRFVRYINYLNNPDYYYAICATYLE